MSNMFVLAQGEDAAVAAGIGIVFLLFVFIGFAVSLVAIAGLWKVFEKAGRPGWGILVPFYNTWLLVEIVGKPPLWFYLTLFPCTAPFIIIMVYIELAKCFGKDTLYGLGLAFLSPIFIPMLGFGSAQYTEPPPLM